MEEKEFGAGLADLHMHSSASDGTDSVLQLLKRIKDNGIVIFALTDHDTMAGVLQMQELVPSGIRFIPGVEFSCRMKDGARCHIIGLNPDPMEPDFGHLLNKARQLRISKMEQRIHILETQYDLYLTSEQLKRIMDHPSPGKPHLAYELALMDPYGTRAGRNPGSPEEEAALLQESFLFYMTGILSRIHTDAFLLEAEDVISCIGAGKGISVWAHPFGENKRERISPEVLETRADRLRGAGLMAMECYYSVYDETQRQMLLSCADQHSLLTSGGSDYHGDRKPNRIGVLGSDGYQTNGSSLTVLNALP